MKLQLPTKDTVLKFSMLAFSVIVLYDPTLPLHAIKNLAEYRAGVVIKLLMVYVFIFYRKFITTQIKRFFYSNHKHTISGVPIESLVEYLVTTERFTREEAKAKWGIAHHKYCDLAKHLESLGILTRGEKNARVLNLQLSRDTIVSRLLEGSILTTTDRGISEEDLSPTSPPFFSMKKIS